MISLQGCNFWMGRLTYDKPNKKYGDWIQNLVLFIKYIGVDFVNDLGFNLYIMPF